MRRPMAFDDMRDDGPRACGCSYDGACSTHLSAARVLADAHDTNGIARALSDRDLWKVSTLRLRASVSLARNAPTMPRLSSLPRPARKAAR